MSPCLIHTVLTTENWAWHLQDGAFGEKEIIPPSAQNWLLQVSEVRIVKGKTPRGVCNQPRATPVSGGDITKGKAVTTPHLERRK